MSFLGKITGILDRPNQEGSPNNDVPLLMRYGAKILGILAGFLSIFLGLFCFIDFLKLQFLCAIIGVLQMVAGVIVISIEMPVCCMFIDHVQTLSNKIEGRPLWNRAALYCGMGALAMILCTEFSIFLGSGLIFATGVLYGMMSLGKKATSEEMRNAATQAEGYSTAGRSNLVNNAQPISISGPPAFDSNV